MRLLMKAFVAGRTQEGQEGSNAVDGIVTHYAELDGHSLMLGSPMNIRPDSEGALEDVELDVMITGIGPSRWVDGTIRPHVLKVEQVREALRHQCCQHDGWETGATREEGISAVFHIPGGKKMRINAERRSRLIRLPRQIKFPGRAWLGFNQRNGFYLAGLESLSDVYIHAHNRR